MNGKNVVPLFPQQPRPAQLQNIAGLQPPHDNNIERACLRAMIYEPSCIDRLQGVITASMFRVKPNRILAEALLDLASTSTPIDGETLRSWLTERKTLDHLPNGIAFIAELINDVAHVENVNAYAMKIRTYALQREVIAICQQITAEGYGDIGEAAIDAQGHRPETGRELPAWFESIQKRLEVVLGKANFGGGMMHAEASELALRQTIARADAIRDGGTGGIYPTGIAGLDLYAADWTLIGAETSDGKTTFLLDMAARLAERGYASIIFSLEQKEDELAQRIDCRAGNVDCGQVRKGQGFDWTAYMSGQAATKTHLIKYITIKPLTPARMFAIVKAFIVDMEAKGIIVALVGIDYMQNMRAPTAIMQSGDEERVLRYNAEQIDEKRKEPWSKHTTWLALSQLTALRDWKGCKALGDKAPNAWKLKRPGKGTKNAPKDAIKPLVVEVPKNRFGQRDVEFETRINDATGRVGDDV